MASLSGVIKMVTVDGLIAFVVGSFDCFFFLSPYLVSKSGGSLGHGESSNNDDMMGVMIEIVRNAPPFC